MPHAEPPGTIRPDPHTPRTLGFLNLAYAVGLMACGTCIDLGALAPTFLSSFAPPPGAARPSVTLRINNRPMPIGSDDSAERLRKAEAEAKDDAARAKIAALRERIEAEGVKDSEESAAVLRVARDPRWRSPALVGHFVADLVSVLTTNLAMLLAGVGLVFLKGWGRRLAVAVAWLKVLRLFALAASMTLFVAPVTRALLGDAEAAMQVPPAEAIAPAAASALVAWSWLLALFGSIYPVATIVLLRRPEVLAAFAPLDGPRRGDRA